MMSRTCVWHPTWDDLLVTLVQVQLSPSLYVHKQTAICVDQYTHRHAVESACSRFRYAYVEDSPISQDGENKRQQQSTYYVYIYIYTCICYISLSLSLSLSLCIHIYIYIYLERERERERERSQDGENCKFCHYEHHTTWRKPST